MVKQLLIITTVFILTCSMRTDKQESFEGVLTYKITFTTLNKDVRYNEYQQNKFGTILKLYISKNGDFRKDYPSSWDKGIDFSIYSAKENKNYLKWRNQDTFTTSDCSKKIVQYMTDSALANETILGEQCKGFFMQVVDSSGGRPQRARLTYYYPSNNTYYIDPKLYTNYNELLYNQTMNKIQAAYFKHILDMGFYQYTYELVKVEKKKLDEGMFKTVTK